MTFAASNASFTFCFGGPGKIEIVSQPIELAINFSEAILASVFIL